MDYNSVKEVTKTVKIALPCRYISNEEAGFREILDSWKQQYVKELEGVVVSYKNVEVRSNSGLIIMDKPFVFYDVKATFELFCPSVGSIVKGKINRISHDLVGCLVHNTINVAIKLQDNGHKELKNYLVLDKMVLFKITCFSFHRRVIRVRGEITEECVHLMQEDPLFRIQNNAQTNTRITYSSEESDNDKKSNSVPDSNNCDEQLQSALATQNSIAETGPSVYNCDSLADGHGFSTPNDSDSEFQHFKTENYSGEDEGGNHRKRIVGGKMQSYTKVKSPKKSPKKNPKKRKRMEDDSAKTVDEQLQSALARQNSVVETDPSVYNCDHLADGHGFSTPNTSDSELQHFKTENCSSEDEGQKKRTVREKMESVQSPKKSPKKNPKKRKRMEDDSAKTEDVDALMSLIKAEMNSCDEVPDASPKKKRKRNKESIESGVNSQSSKKSKIKKSPKKEKSKVNEGTDGIPTSIDIDMMLAQIKAESSYYGENEDELETKITLEPLKSLEKKKSKAKEKPKGKEKTQKSSSSNNIDTRIAHRKGKYEGKAKKKGKKKGDVPDENFSNSKKSTKKKKSKKKEEHKGKDKKKKNDKYSKGDKKKKSKRKELKSKAES